MSQRPSSIIKSHTTVMRPVDQCACTHWHTTLFPHTLLKFYTAEPKSSRSPQPSVCRSRRPLGFLAAYYSSSQRHTSVQNIKLHSKPTHHWDMKWYSAVWIHAGSYIWWMLLKSGYKLQGCFTILIKTSTKANENIQKLRTFLKSPRTKKVHSTACFFSRIWRTCKLHLTVPQA